MSGFYWHLLLKTLSGGPAGVWTHDNPHGSPVLYQLSQPVGGCVAQLFELKVTDIKIVLTR